jgi:hypothetical protein
MINGDDITGVIAVIALIGGALHSLAILGLSIGKRIFWGVILALLSLPVWGYIWIFAGVVGMGCMDGCEPGFLIRTNALVTGVALALTAGVHFGYRLAQRIEIKYRAARAASEAEAGNER